MAAAYYPGRSKRLRIRYGMINTRNTPRFVVYGVSATAVICLVVFACVVRRNKRSAIPRACASMPSRRFVNETGQSSRKALLSLLKGRKAFIVWSSNRYGNHDIFLLAFPDFRLVRLTQNWHTDYYPRISPQGDRIVFSRSQRPWVSQRDKIPWDAYVLNLRSGEEILVARNANTPTWSHDGQHIYFQRNGEEFVEHRITDGRERVLFKSGAAGIPDGWLLNYPHFSDEKGKLAVTVRGAARMTALFGIDGSYERVAGGCTLSWAPDRSYLYFVDHKGTGNNAFYRLDPHTRDIVKWLDLPGNHSHEYFPSVSNDGLYLVFGASTGGHELDIADYEIFLWKIGDPWQDAARVTFNTANDCWPDIYIFE